MLPENAGITVYSRRGSPVPGHTPWLQRRNAKTCDRCFCMYAHVHTYMESYIPRTHTHPARGYRTVTGGAYSGGGNSDVSEFPRLYCTTDPTSWLENSAEVAQWHGRELCLYIRVCTEQRDRRFPGETGPSVCRVLASHEPSPTAGMHRRLGVRHPITHCSVRSTYIHNSRRDTVKIPSCLWFRQREEASAFVGSAAVC